MKKHIMVEMEQAHQHSQEEEEEEEEEEELEEGPPPGFQCMPSQQQQQQQKQEDMDHDDNNNDDDDDDDDEFKGPPPGFSTPPALPSDVDMRSNENGMDEDDGPPPGWHSVTAPQPQPSKTPLAEPASSDLRKLIAEISDVKMKNNLEDMEDEDEGPPPGWQLIPPPQPSLPSASAGPSDIEMGSRRNDIRDKSKIPQLGSQSTPSQESLALPSPAVPPPPSAAVTSETGSKQGGTKGDNQGPKSKRQARSPSQPLQPTQLPPPRRAPLLSDMGQMVCGSCRQLLSYPRGAKYVQCSPCQTVNLVLEANQVGQVKCRGCSVLLMYPYGSPAVRCSSCRFVTDIGANNSRPPLSEQQARPRPPSSRVH